MMRNRNLFVAVLVVSALTVGALANGKGKLTLDLYMDWEYVASPQISSDGSQIVYTRRWTDKLNDKFETDVWIINADGSKNRFLVRGSSPVWSPDGKRVAYLAQGQPAGPQVWVKWLDTGEETQLTRLERAPTNIDWSPDGRRIAFNMNVPSKPAFTVKLPPAPRGAKWIDPPRVIERLDYRADGQGYRADGYAHIFVIGTDSGGTPRQVTEGDYNHGSPEWTPDSQTILFSAIRKPEAEYQRGDSEIYSVSLKDGVVRQLTDRRGSDQNPVISPDGRQVAYTGSDQSENTYTVSKLYLMNIDGSNKKTLTEGFDRAPARPVWAADSSACTSRPKTKGLTIFTSSR